MIFSSIEFLLWFLPIFLIVYGITPRKYRNLTLLVGSIVFYAMGDVRYLPLLMISILCNYFLGLHLAKRSPKTLWRKKLLLILTLGANLAVLLWFKDWGGSAGLPLGISFYTFQILSYQIDVYRGEVSREYSFLKFATYVIMFPKLISGPITRYGDISDSLTERTFTVRGLEDGMKLFILGLAAKVLLADRVGILWHEVQVTGFESISTPLAWLAAIAYSMEIYFDFWGYSLMAMGLGRMMGIELPANFRRPYMARSVRDFYRRWHMTLGQWFCRYVYIPLGGSRQGELRTIFNLLVVWMLTGIWHGAGWNFLFWGLWFAFFLILEKLFLGDILESVPKVFGRIYTLAVVLISWVFFALENPGEILAYLQAMFGMNGIGPVNSLAMFLCNEYLVLLVIALVACLPLGSRLVHALKSSKTGPAMALYRLGEKVIPAVLLLLSVAYIVDASYNPFLYFRF